jgi:hypothetical protein
VGGQKLISSLEKFQIGQKLFKEGQRFLIGKKFP